eukprot:TRINITY_DN38907_c0_g1_i1.p1 TRINITY_DN38907_c0_g1~~TRINITY_DN38907_c0_g1_i1.p1  ORF type:complete len:306 (-),score=56.55 TRINITY_DN38907_c0_g1_i1:14-931(-)
MCIRDRHLREPSGLVQPFDFDLPAVAALRATFALQSHDVAIATYPKCGTTWMQQIVLLLLRGAQADVAPMHDAPWLEMSVSSAANGAQSSSPPISVEDLCALENPSKEVDDGRRVWKTHAPATAMPWTDGVAGTDCGARIVVVTRNSKDTAISMLHHTKNIPPFRFSGEWEHFAEMFLEGNVESSSFWDWHTSWWAAKCERPNAVLWMSFEGMTADLEGAVSQVARHLGLCKTAEEIKAVAERCTFGTMKKEAQTRDLRSSQQGEHVKAGHIREGKVGGWRSVMSEETAARFEELDATLCAVCDE